MNNFIRFVYFFAIMLIITGCTGNADNVSISKSQKDSFKKNNHDLTESLLNERTDPTEAEPMPPLWIPED